MALLKFRYVYLVWADVYNADGTHYSSGMNFTTFDKVNSRKRFFAMQDYFSRAVKHYYDAESCKIKSFQLIERKVVLPWQKQSL